NKSAEIPQNMQPITYKPALHPENRPHPALVPLQPQVVPSQPQQQQQQQQQQYQPHPVPSSQTIQMRALIVIQDASIIIGKGSQQIKEICKKSRGRATISEAVPGDSEQNLTVGRPLDAVSKAFGLIVRCINDEPFEVPLVPSSCAVTIWFVVPNSQMGSVIGKAGSKIKEIQDMSSAC
ncbi:hypothetical protein BY996DRAFT_4593577, partial [Phakopsora pachyrhizi]